MNLSEKMESQKKFNENNNTILITTSGNMIGIDFKNCNAILHHAIPTSIADYVQDIGRLSRKGEMAFALLYTTSSTILSLKKILAQTSTDRMIRRSRCNSITSNAPIYNNDNNNHAITSPTFNQKSSLTEMNTNDDVFDSLNEETKYILKMLKKENFNILIKLFIKIFHIRIS
ncbi:Helicase, C-terminal domain and P-loop containing nucleoside triphosphate hydrolase domain-containing protein [Strongyloides ratti]|uniref:Helicase, C-terminal domain and P-loop containing nucleoside triphosphate hydrolase domain-containing protein n=1 Tax=Strongyloides ratti TaxID=34506 RepID=A0A090L277_STRRB|nr:Helicase, C-terminal domain and P-loop containing nucleoside triphosphate hydrolase domain-containing protein [Strongyloides ratti]CEF61584.1 Helicase, C-terminal domain and P-loop containing nucleoside triphosphate hydrolase domain-containing protein [Strongyloides ratti]